MLCTFRVNRWKSNRGCIRLMIITARNEVVKFMLYTCLSVHRGGGRRSTWAGTPPRAGTPPGQVHSPGRYPSSRYTPRQVHSPGRYTPWTGTPLWAGTPPWQVHPQAGTSPRQVRPRAGIPRRRYTPPKADGYCCGRYAFCWNAFLFLLASAFGIGFSFIFCLRIAPHVHRPSADGWSDLSSSPDLVIPSPLE